MSVRAEEVLDRYRVAVFIVAYNAERHIQSVIDRIPAWVREKLAEIYVIDDSSSDHTFEVTEALKGAGAEDLNLYRTPYNQGYGGNQILGYQHAIDRGHDIVVLLHGDGQYAPEELPKLLEPYLDQDVAAVFGSRFMEQGAARRGGMPLYKYFGNRTLTWFQNRMLSTQLSEMHSGYRSYRMDELKKVPFAFNAKGFDFDADIIVQFVEAGFTIVEVPIPTYYGDEICHVNGLQYAWRCLRSCVINALMKVELFYDPKFDLSHLDSTKRYIKKVSPYSVHHFVRNYPFAESSKILDLGGGDGESVSEDLVAKGHDLTSVDQRARGERRAGVRLIEHDLDDNWVEALAEERFDAALALDVVEHLSAPEQGMERLFKVLDQHGSLILSTGNVAFLPIRMMLALGAFNYGRRGILDLTHKRLFTLKSFRRLANNHGFEVEQILGFGVPLTDLASDSMLVRLLERLSFWLARFWPGMFAYQVILVCRRPLSHSELVGKTFGEDSSP
jgi:glycosyltransferase involved in cell wall biosynthesis